MSDSKIGGLNKGFLRLICLVWVSKKIDVYISLDRPVSDLYNGDLKFWFVFIVKELWGLEA